MAERRADVRVQAPHAAKQFEKAPAEVRKILRERADRLAEDPQAGTYISTSRVPTKALKRWERRVGPVANLWKVDLPDGLRALYTVGSDGPHRVVLVLEIVNHTEYDRLLGYG